MNLYFPIPLFRVPVPGEQNKNDREKIISEILENLFNVKNMNLQVEISNPKFEKRPVTRRWWWNISALKIKVLRASKEGKDDCINSITPFWNDNGILSSTFWSEILFS